MAELDQHLLNDYQRGFPLIAAPFARIAADLGVAENQVIEALARLRREGAVSRVGAVFRPHTIGVSTLAALAVPDERLAEVAQRVSAHPQVNHNYEREHHYNLWFVVAAPDSARLDAVLAELQAASACPLLVLPMLEDFHIDLGFDLARKMTGTPGRVRGGHRGMKRDEPVSTRLPHPRETALIGALQQGIPLVTRPYAEIGAEAGMSETEVLSCLADLLEAGIIRRLGVVVRHHELGYRANAMVVWDVPDGEVSETGACLGQFDCVTLCYRRPRRLPEWRYNLFTMIHGRDRDEVLGLIDQLRVACNVEHIPFEVLFSRRRFKQCGARYVETAAV
ncbi:MAG: Lrp/AsnC family transcriptional regulator [Sulfuricella sp.]|nr:Lrp/AsnC family transcriptional regulator [Sulfuricella sp.]